MPYHAPVLQVNGSTVGTFWQCLGVYALPGQTIQVTLPSSVVNTNTASLHIGGWTDKIYQ
jgi:hypothetical protein